MSATYWRVIAAGLLVGGVIGCGGSKAGGLNTVAAGGTVTFKGQPVEGATVTFAPTEKTGRAATGKTDASGHFKLTTKEPGDGAVPGSYKVAISKVSGDESAPALPPGVDPTSPEGMDASYRAKAEREKKGGGGAAAKDVIPAKYKVGSSSQLTAEVKAGTKNDFTFDLKE